MAGRMATKLQFSSGGPARQVGRVNIDLAEALLNPAAVFATPDEVLHEGQLEAAWMAEHAAPTTHRAIGCATESSVPPQRPS